jgi:hypothetical protein
MTIMPRRPFECLSIWCLLLLELRSRTVQTKESNLSDEGNVPSPVERTQQHRVRSVF